VVKRVGLRVWCVALLLAGMCTAGFAQELDDATLAKVEETIRSMMQTTGVPSAQVGIVRDGKVIYTGAFGAARLKDDGTMNSAATTELAATSAMRYPIGSISKQFTAAAVLLLVEDGKMSLDDPVAKWFPELTRAKDVKVRNLLTHTSGYSDYAPQDYTIPAWTKPVDPTKLVKEWAGKPLDFEPGTQWQYSNTNFVLAALIVEKVSGMPFWDFLESRVLQPLALKGALNLDTQRDQVEPRGYMRNALGPLRPAILEAPGWYYGDASLAMPAETLLDWDISQMNRMLLKPASYDAMETSMKLADGSDSHYGLGVEVKTRDGHRVIEHDGEVGGFVAENLVYPDDKAAMVVLTNEEANPAAIYMARKVLPMVLGITPQPAAQKVASVDAPPKADPQAEAQVKEMLAGLQDGKLDRKLLTSDGNFYFSKQAIGDFASSLKPLGEIKSVTLSSKELRGGMTFRVFQVAFATKNVQLTTYTMPDGRIEQFLVGPAS
jgi:D-alanyl-D-alanine carboxypeptidase